MAMGSFWVLVVYVSDGTSYHKEILQISIKHGWELF